MNHLHSTPDFQLSSLWDLPMGHLQLNRRAYNRCHEQGCRNIGEVIKKWEAGLLNGEIVGPSASEEIASAAQCFLKHTASGRSFPWEAFWQERPIVAYRLALSMDRFALLTADTREATVGILHLKKACSGLEDADIGTVGKLIDAAKCDIEHPKNFGAAAHEEVVSALRSLNGAILDDGSVDWLKFAKLQNYQVIPPLKEPPLDGPSLLSKLPQICKAVIMLEKEPERAWDLFYQRFLTTDESQPTLISLGEKYGITRERVRQIGKDGIIALSRPFLRRDYRGLTFRFRDSLSDLFVRAKDHFNALGLSAWRRQAWVSELSQLWQIPEHHLNRYLRLILPVLEFDLRSPDTKTLDAIVFRTTVANSKISYTLMAVDLLHKTLVENNAGMDRYALADALQKQNKKFGALDELPELVNLCSSVETVGADVYRLRFDQLDGREEWAYRILIENGAPLDRTVLLERINKKLPKDVRIAKPELLVNNMIRDVRLKPIGKSGQWTLTDWGVETGSIIELIEGVLTEADEPLERDEIVDQVNQKRYGSDASVKLLLSMNKERFCRTGPNTFGLSKWKVAGSSIQFWDSDEVGDFITSYFADREQAKVAFPDVCNAFSSKSGFSKPATRGILAKHPALKVKKVDYKTRTAEFRSDWKKETPLTRIGRRVLQSDKITEEVKKILWKTATGELPLIGIVQQLEDQMGISRASIYSAISQSDELETFTVDGSSFKICKLPGKRRDTYPQLNQLQNAVWRQECANAISKITLEDVDLGLFALGRQFSHCMRSLLMAAKDSGAFPVMESNLESLNNRIDWAVRHQVFIDQSTLHLLRVERIQRESHIPNDNERHALLKFAPFLVELYLDYIIMIEAKIAEFSKMDKPASVGPSSEL